MIQRSHTRTSVSTSTACAVLSLSASLFGGAVDAAFPCSIFLAAIVDKHACYQLDPRLTADDNEVTHSKVCYQDRDHESTRQPPRPQSRRSCQHNDQKRICSAPCELRRGTMMKVEPTLEARAELLLCRLDEYSKEFLKPLAEAAKSGLTKILSCVALSPVFGLRQRSRRHQCPK